VTQRKSIRRRIVMTTIKTLVVLGVLYAGPMYCFMGRLTFPTEREYVAKAKVYVPVVQAIYDYKADHGSMPAKLQDLVPAYIASIPDPTEIAQYDEVGLIIRAYAPHTEILYNFAPDHEGWSAGGDFGTGPLPLPKLSSNHVGHPSPLSPTTQSN
jgi:hypothetical protein